MLELTIPPDHDRDALFVKHYVRHHDAVQACTQARIWVGGYDMRDVASIQLQRPDIRAMIARAESSTREPEPAMEFTRESAVSDLQEVYERCMSAGEFTPAITAKKTQAQLMGLLDQNVTLTVKNEVTAMTDEQILKMIKQRQAARLTAETIDGDFSETPKAPKPPGKQMLALGLAAFGALNAKD